MGRLALSVGRFYVALTALLLLCLYAGCEMQGNGRGTDARTARADAPTEGRARLTDEGAEPLADEGSADGQDKGAEFQSAAAENSRLRTELDWSFGGKAQRGWAIYVPLIKELIGTERGEDTRAFAQALSRWQKSNGLAPRGVLDGETLFRMIGVWQSRRLKDKTIPPPDKLLTAPVSDFYDPSRAEELRKVEPQTYAAYKRLTAEAARALGLGRTRDGALAPGEQYLKIVSAFRSPEYQEKLRQQSPNSGPGGLAKVSPHFTGRALDLYVGGEPVSTEDSNRMIQINTKVYQWLVKNGPKFGFYPYFYEPWHWEYRGS